MYIKCMEYNQPFGMGHFPKVLLVKRKGHFENVKLSTAKHDILWILVTKKTHLNELVQWQLTPGKILYQFELVYYRIVTPLLQQNNFCAT